MKTWISRGLRGLVVLLIAATLGFIAWTQINRYPATPDAQLAARAAERNSGWLIFRPAQPTGKGFVFYPGGLVAAEAYAPFARALAERGIFTVITPMPLDLAILNPNEAGDVIAAFPEIKTWAIGGHSLGGAAGGIFLQNYPEQTVRVRGLVLWGARLNDSIDVKALPIQALSIYGSRDGVAAVYPTEAIRRVNLPPDSTTLVTIDGGNHSMFGDYGLQNGDNSILGDPQRARAQIIDATADMIVALP